MVNTTLFRTYSGARLPGTDTINEAGGNAYSFSAEHALAQLAVTGCLGATYYATDENQLEQTLALATKVDPVFLAKTALYARREAHMKDMPALLVAVLSMRDPTLFAKVFPRVVDNARMIRTFVQIVRSGRIGRKSLGTRPKRAVRGWLDAQDDDELFRASIGERPSLADVVKMVHPKPLTATRRALYAYLIGRAYEAKDLPPLVRSFEQYKTDATGEVPDVPYQLLTSLPLGTAEWVEIAKHAGWQVTRMNLATFARHGVFGVPGMPELIAERLRDREAIAKARVFPYQLLIAYVATRGSDLPRVVVDALHDALEMAIANVPRFEGRVWVLPDVSGSMQSPVTGDRGEGQTTAVRCVDVAALIAASFLRTATHARVLPFDDRLRDVVLEPRDTVLTNATKLAAVGGGGTSVSLPLAHLDEKREHADLVVYVSDNQSWVDASARGQASATMTEWAKLKARCPRAKLVCIDLQPYAHTQAPDRDDVLNVGGFSDRVFDVIAAFAQARGEGAGWVDVIQRLEIETA
ncbi:RNA-binding protein [Sandaracinus amylolyticus]|uniref:RNA-binding protein n=1 Tax=Sandaracinus amylolyticus TaxID=927083 RepID=UPI001F339315|nr:RNA-binding protein [Sandaracinus amylolyticus]UJR86550.1 Hypothetical protein I5071_86500 [Sandaracinus amylolyticus]